MLFPVSTVHNAREAAGKYKHTMHERSLVSAAALEWRHGTLLVVRPFETAEKAKPNPRMEATYMLFNDVQREAERGPVSPYSPNLHLFLEASEQTFVHTRILTRKITSSEMFSRV